ncbi:WYL domain-containing protein [uncultured Cohaesibacter sp.]|uniref:WYL domain-containing protein n=1 Tax=uncultured Cohaesibacter sp. TaxID=1002546 RepID=UPI0029C8750A|nr:WYL domain-containing protein [uncultured Cohaesibacter sp.]
MSVMEISRAQASKDINSYIADHPDHLFYDKSARTYVMGSAFKPHYLVLDAGEYLGSLEAIANGVPIANSDWIVETPAILHLSLPTRGLVPAIVRTVVRACTQRRRLEICYQSMSSEAPSRRKIEPYALAHDGFRWHARAFCVRDQMFKDFVLSRILEAKPNDEAKTDPSEDTDWLETIILRIAPHPDLSSSQRRIVELDYDMTDGTAELAVRKCLLFYNLKRLGLDTRPDIRAAQDQHIILRNADEVFAALGRKAP